MKWLPSHIPDVCFVKPEVFIDRRGFFMETFRQDLFENRIGPVTFVQDNHSRSCQGTSWGLLEQKP
jgi:dTDP-4-dehydrorhamnose 3,5-epimerase